MILMFAILNAMLAGLNYYLWIDGGETRYGVVSVVCCLISVYLLVVAAQEE